MGRRLALLSDCNHWTPWTRASGSEVAVKVTSLGEGDKVMMKVGLRPDGELILILPEGLTSLQGYSVKEWDKYQVSKTSGLTAAMTAVEVFFG